MNGNKAAAPGGEARARLWELRQAASMPGVLQLYIYGYVEPDEYDWYGDRIESETSAEHFREELAKYPEATEIEIFINSMGGDVVEGTAIYNQLKRHPAKKTVYVDGFAASIASVIAMAGDEIVMPANTLMMVHNMSWVAWGNPAQLRKAAEDLEVINSTGREAYLLKAGDKLSRERLTEMMDAETWLPARECVELGLADRLAEEAGEDETGTEAPRQRAGAVKLAARAMGFDRLAARVSEAEARAARAEEALREAEKCDQEREKTQETGSQEQSAGTPETKSRETEDGHTADGGDAGAGRAQMSIMAALCGLK